MEELHNQYLNSGISSVPKDPAFVEAQLKAVAVEVAIGTVRWWTEFSQTQTLEDQRQRGCRKDQTAIPGGEAVEHN